MNKKETTEKATKTKKVTKTNKSGKKVFAAKKTSTAKTAASSKKATKKGMYFYACGKRKTSSARVRVYPDGEGAVEVNERALNDYFPTFAHKSLIKAPFQFVEAGKKFNVTARVIGGGVNSQADAIKHGISRALVLMDANLRPSLKKAGFLTRDPRRKERKKPGLKRARRSPQWSKR